MAKGNAKRKNILFITFDDACAYWRHKYAYQEPLQVPNLDRICEQSTAFHAAYSQSPICNPSRSSFMTSRSPHDTGILDNETYVFDVVPAKEMWPVRLKERGYFNGSGGNVHHRYFAPIPRHFSVLYSDKRKHFADDFKLPPGTEVKHHGGKGGGIATIDPKDDKVFHDYQTSQSAIDFLNDYDGDAPFYREVGFFSPHVPFYTPDRFKTMYERRNFTPPEAWRSQFSSSEYIEKAYPENMDLDQDHGAWWRLSLRNYFSALSHGDYHLGRVWDALKNSRHAENTIVIVTSDHGFQLGNLNRMKKSGLWEQNSGVPLIIHDPDQPRQMVCHDPVGLIDIGPTVLDYAGIRPPKTSLGRSLRAQVWGKKPRQQRVIPTFYEEDISVRKGDYRLIRYKNGETQMYDVINDYWQLNDLGQEHKEFEQMHRALRECASDWSMALPQ